MGLFLLFEHTADSSARSQSPEGSPSSNPVLAPGTPSISIPSPSSSAQERGEILSVPTGSKVPEIAVATGTVTNVPTDHEVWLIVESGGEYYPLDTPVHISPNGTWSAEVDTGEPGEKGIKFTWNLVDTDPPATRMLKDYADKVNAGVTPSTGDRNAVIAEFGSATNTSDVAARARALRDVAENSILQQQEFNRAFVLMQFMGYLRRDPNSGQDTDYTGYEFWLNKLNQFNGNYNAAEMVKAFIVSTEYRGRF